MEELSSDSSRTVVTDHTDLKQVRLSAEETKMIEHSCHINELSKNSAFPPNWTAE